MVPSKIKPFFKVDYIKNDIISGSINCCKENNFKIYYTGMIKKYYFRYVFVWEKWCHRVMRKM